MTDSPRRPPVARRTLLWLIVPVLGLLALVGWQIGERWAAANPPATPALWVASKQGRQVYLFGTIHAVPRGARWMSPKIADAVARSDLLVTEVTNHFSGAQRREVFDRLGRRDGLPPVAARLNAGDAKRYRALAGRHGRALDALDGYEDWAAALLINAVASADLSLSSEDAGETVLGRQFAEAGKRNLGLETIEGQLGLFDRLNPKNQYLLISQSVREAERAELLYNALYAAWAKGDLATLQRQFLQPFAQAPELKHILIDRRNAQWAAAIDGPLAKEGTAFVAVGAGHLLGADGLPALLIRRGWRVERLQ